MQWSNDELTVLMAILISQPFKVGDDRHEVCQHIAREFGRTPGAVDSQWRNIKYHLFRLDLYLDAGRYDHIGEDVKNVVDRYRVDLGELRRDAHQIIGVRGWNLEGFL